MKSILSLVIFIITITVQAHEFYTAKVLLLNGNVIEGQATLPDNVLLKTSIEIKENNITSTIESNDIYQILYVINGNNYFFERNNVGITQKAFEKHRTNYSTGKEWYLVIFSDDSIKAYISSQYYYVDKEKGIISTHSFEGRNINFGTSYLLKRPNEDAPTVITMEGISNSKFREWASSYFEETPELVTRINKKEFKNSRIEELALAYASYQKK
jgi:hypothetical protein